MLFNFNLVCTSFSCVLWLGLCIDFIRTYVRWHLRVAYESYSRIILEVLLQKNVIEEDTEYHEAKNHCSSQSGLPLTEFRAVGKDFEMFHFQLWFIPRLKTKKIPHVL